MKDIFEKLGLFYLGKQKDDALCLYKSKDLTTHAMIVGMTGSGKTGLGITLLEEAAIDNIPAIVIDPKGDMGNLCLAFENLSPQEFAPWSTEPQKSAKLWKEGLKASHQDLQRVAKFAKIEKTIYTPGSSAGVSVDILSSFEAPSQEVIEDSDAFTSLISSTVSSLLTLISFSASNPHTKEHLLLSNILYHFWIQGVSLNLEDIINYVAEPPFKKVGVLSLATFYKQSDRMKLAVAINGLISSVGFASWLQGEALNIEDILYDDAGNAKVAIFNIAHLNDAQRMFFVTLLLNKYLNWMRKQSGSSVLRSLLYMDEIYGFFPPVKNPPSKEPMMLLLKQARAFGVGVVLSTQNPSDIDYKGASNIGSWFIGKLQTKQDIQKVMQGMALDTPRDKKFVSQMIASLRGREFLLKNIHHKSLLQFSTRWVLSYLKGPITKNDIKKLMHNKKVTQVKEKLPLKKKLSFSCKKLSLTSLEDESEKAFLIRVQNSLKELRDAKVEKLQARYETKYMRLEKRKTRLSQRLTKEKSDVSRKTTNAFIDIGLTLLGAFFGRKNSTLSSIRKGSSAFKKTRGVFKEKGDVSRVNSQLLKLQDEIEKLDRKFETEVFKIDENFSLKNYTITSLQKNSTESQ